MRLSQETEVTFRQDAGRKDETEVRMTLERKDPYKKTLTVRETFNIVENKYD